MNVGTIGHQRVFIFNLQPKRVGNQAIPPACLWLAALSSIQALCPFRGGHHSSSDSLTLKMLTRAGGKLSSGTYKQHTHTHTRPGWCKLIPELIISCLCVVRKWQPSPRINQHTVPGCPSVCCTRCAWCLSLRLFITTHRSRLSGCERVAGSSCYLSDELPWK